MGDFDDLDDIADMLRAGRKGDSPRLPRTAAGRAAKKVRFAAQRARGTRHALLHHVKRGGTPITLAPIRGTEPPK